MEDLCSFFDRRVTRRVAAVPSGCPDSATAPVASLAVEAVPAELAPVSRAPDILLQSAAWSYISSHPSYVVEVAYQNSLHVFDLAGLRWTLADIATSYGLPPICGDADAIFTVACLLLALAGVISPSGREGIPLAYWTAPVLLWITTVVLQGLPRFRAEIDPFLVQLSAVTIAWAWSAYSQRRFIARPATPCTAH